MDGDRLLTSSRCPDRVVTSQSIFPKHAIKPGKPTWLFGWQLYSLNITSQLGLLNRGTIQKSGKRLFLFLYMSLWFQGPRSKFNFFKFIRGGGCLREDTASRMELGFTTYWNASQLASFLNNYPSSNNNPLSGCLLLVTDDRRLWHMTLMDYWKSHYLSEIFIVLNALIFLQPLMGFDPAAGSPTATLLLTSDKAWVLGTGHCQ